MPWPSSCCSSASGVSSGGGAAAAASPAASSLLLLLAPPLLVPRRAQASSASFPRSCATSSRSAAWAVASARVGGWGEEEAEDAEEAREACASPASSSERSWTRRCCRCRCWVVLGLVLVVVGGGFWGCGARRGRSLCVVLVLGV